MVFVHVSEGLLEEHVRVEGVLLRGLLRLPLAHWTSWGGESVVHILLWGEVVDNNHFSVVNHVLEGLGNISHDLRSLLLYLNKVLVLASLHNGSGSLSSLG